MLSINTLQKTGIDEKDILIIHELYWNETAKLKLNYGSQTSNIRKIFLRNAYSHYFYLISTWRTFQLAFKGHTTGIRVNYISINNLRNAINIISEHPRNNILGANYECHQ